MTTSLHVLIISVTWTLVNTCNFPYSSTPLRGTVGIIIHRQLIQKCHEVAKNETKNIVGISCQLSFHSQIIQSSDNFAVTSSFREMIGLNTPKSIPIRGWALAIAYNLWLNGTLRLDFHQIQMIFSGGITSWIDKRLLKNNAWLKNSGCTSIKIVGLTSVMDNDTLLNNVSTCNLIDLLRNRNVLSYSAESFLTEPSLLVNVKCSIGFLPMPISASSFESLPLGYAKIMNKAGKYVGPTLTGVQATLDYYNVQDLMNSQQWIYCNATNPKSYPLTMLERAVVKLEHFGNCSQIPPLYRLIKAFIVDTFADASVVQMTNVQKNESLTLLGQMTCDGVIVADCVNNSTARPLVVQTVWTKYGVTILSVGGTFGVLLLALIIYVIIHSAHMMRILRTNQWLIPIEDIAFQYMSPRELQQGRMMSISGAGGPSVRSTSVTGSENGPELDASSVSSSEEIPVMQVLSWPGKYRGGVVGIRIFSTVVIPRSRMTLDNKLKLSRLVRAIKHDNVVRFCGLTSLENEYLIVTEYCSRGTLYDALYCSGPADNLGFREEVKSAIVYDVASAMAYLHSEGLVHGTLSTSSCHLDSKWTVKIADWEFKPLENALRFCKGSRRRPFLIRMKEAMLGLPTDIARRPSTWEFRLAPELLRTNYKGSICEATDVYSFGILVFEVFTEAEPFSDLLQALSPAGIVEAIKTRRLRPHWLRPVNREARQIMESCWNDNPQLRPKFDSLKKLMSKAFPRRKQMLESVIKNLETYTEELELDIIKKEKEFASQSQRCQDFLRGALPPNFAESLIARQSTRTEEKRHVGILVLTPIHKLHPLQSINEIIAAEHAFVDKLQDAMQSLKSDVFCYDLLGGRRMLLCGLTRGTTSRNVSDLIEFALRLMTSVDGTRVLCALHCGRIISTIIGAAAGPIFAPFGEAVHHAEEISSLCQQGLLLVTPAVIRSLKARFADQYVTETIEQDKEQEERIGPVFNLRRADSVTNANDPTSLRRRFSASTSDAQSSDEEERSTNQVYIRIKNDGPKHIRPSTFATKRRAFLSIPNALSRITEMAEVAAKKEAVVAKANRSKPTIRSNVANAKKSHKKAASERAILI